MKDEDTSEEVLDDPNQLALFEKGEAWENEWKGMPEFVQDDLSPWKTLLVHFENRRDMDRFSGLVKQRIGEKTQSIWYPQAEIGRYANKRYVSSMEEKE